MPRISVLEKKSTTYYALTHETMSKETNMQT